MGDGLRVGLVVPRFAPFEGGIETYTLQAARGLAARGVHVTVITQAPRGAGLPPRSRQDGYDVERYLLPVGSVFNVPSPAALRAAVRPGRFDVLWLHSYHTPLAWLVSEASSAPLVLTPHYHGVGHTRLHAALHRPYGPAGRRLMRRSRTVVVDTEAEAALVRRDFPAEVADADLEVVPLAVENPVRGVPFATSGPVVLTVARQEPYKRADLLVRAAGELRRRGSSAQLVVVGGGSAVRPLTALVRELVLSDVVTLTGRVDDDELDRWWATASVYATASEQEAFGISLAQALVGGLDVVASGIPAHREVVRQAGGAVTATLVDHDADDETTARRYADALERLLAGTCAPRSQPATAGRCLLPTPDVVAERLHEILAAAAAAEPAPSRG
jgi:glycosyltransferase involved in cell wall biosynthesis